MFDSSIFNNLNDAGAASSFTIFMLVIAAILAIMNITHLKLIELLHRFLKFLIKIFGKFINKSEQKYHRDIQIGKINEKRTKVKLYKFLSELIIDLNMEPSGITPYELLALTVLIVAVVTLIVCQLLFGNMLMSLIFIPIILIGTFCIMYTKANVAHDTRIEAVLEAENIICNNIKVGVLVAVRESLDVLPKSVKPYFKDFVDNIEQKNYHIKTALMELNSKLGGVADDFIKKCIVFEMEEEHGIAGMFADVVEINNINMEMRTNMKRKFEEVKHDFIIGAVMIFAFLGGVLAIYPNVRDFYLKNGIGQIILGVDALLLITEFVYITYLRAKEL